MKFINKQRFLAELGKLLTFMYDEDKQEALGMYADLFDNFENEEEIAKALVSPTRQAVVIARAYDPSQSEYEDYEDEPDFIKAIKNSVKDVDTKIKGQSKVSGDQFTFFQTAENDAAARGSVSEDFTIDGIDENGEIIYGTVSDGEEEEFIEELLNDSGTVSVLSPGLLVLYILIAIPLGLAAIALMVVFAALFFAIAAAAGFLAFYSLTAVFDPLAGFDIIADILVLGGLAVVLAAIGLLALWAGIWFLFGAIPGIVRDAIELGGKFCRREVAA